MDEKAIRRAALVTVRRAILERFRLGLGEERGCGGPSAYSVASVRTAYAVTPGVAQPYGNALANPVRRRPSVKQGLHVKGPPSCSFCWSALLALVVLVK
jgi:hypothetical protein